MNSSSRFDIQKAENVSDFVCETFACSKGDVFCFKDTVFKKSVAYVLFKFFEYDKRLIASYLNMTYLYVPTAADEIENMFLRVPGFRNNLIEVLKKSGYERELVSGIGAVA